MPATILPVGGEDVLLATFTSGLLIGLAIIMPIGPQNLSVINTGTSVGFPQVLAASLTSTLCDALLIVVGVLGVGAALTQNPALRIAFFVGGVIFLVYLVVKLLPTRHDAGVPEPATSTGSVVRRAVAMSLLNPHAIIDTVVVVGAAAALQNPTGRPIFAVGAICASLVWFLLLGLGAAAIRHRLTQSIRVWIERTSGSILILYTLVFLVTLATNKVL